MIIIIARQLCQYIYYNGLGWRRRKRYIQFYYNEIIIKQMNKKQKINKLAHYLKLQGNIWKKSTNFFIGYQNKFWKILQNGTQIGYRNMEEDQIRPQNIFNLYDVFTQQLQAEEELLLHTPHRVYQLKFNNQNQCKEWMKAITLLKKEIRRKKKKQAQKKNVKVNILYNGNDSTLPSNNHQSISALNIQKAQNIGAIKNIAGSISEARVSKQMPHDELKQKYQHFLKNMPINYAHYHVTVFKLKVKVKELFKSNFMVHHFILFSSKSLIPEQFINEQNLTSSLLPHWADIDCFYKIGQKEANSSLVFQMIETVDFVQSSEQCSLKINVTKKNTMAKETVEFYCDSLNMRKKFRETLQIARINAMQSSHEGNFSKKNYDNLILLHDVNLQEFNFKVNQLIQPLKPAHHNFQPEVIRKIIDNFSPFIIEVITILQKKVKVPTDVILDFLNILHEQVRYHLKLVWDSSYSVAKSGDILHMLKSISKYESIINNYVKDRQLQQSLKELSKFYMRICFKNFQTIILGIVNQQKKNNFFLQQNEGEQPYLQTNGISDLFKFIYDVFDLAIPCWNNKLHLHNIHRVIKRALEVFISELKASIDEQDMSIQQLIGISNNYIRFCEQVDEFYDQKLSQLKEQTRQIYNQLKNNYRQLSMIAIDKIVLPIKLQFKKHYNKQTFFTINTVESYKIIIHSQIYKHLPKVHFIFKKRYYERIFNTIKEEFFKLLQKETKAGGSKKKPELSKILQKMQSFKKDCLEINDLVTKSKFKIQKEFVEVIELLTTSKKEEIKNILFQSKDFFKKKYKNFLSFRNDYNEDSPLYTYINNAENQIGYLDSLKPQEAFPEKKRNSFSKDYIQDFDRNSISSSIQKQKIEVPSQQQKIKIISQGFVKRSKQKNGIYDDIYLKLKKSILYIYQNEKMERCQNTITIEDIQEVKVPNAEKAFFIIIYTTLNRIKQMKIKCQSQELSNRWIYSLQLQMRRLSNDKKMKPKGIKIKQKKSNLIIDYDELMNGMDYFSYNL